MKVSNDFTFLQKANALLVVAGAQVAKIYRLKDGQINEKDTIEIETPTFTDREGHFEHHANGLMHGSGSVYENQDDYMQNKFLKELTGHISALKNTFDKIYLFSPGYILKSIKNTLPDELANKIQKEINGNYTKHHPNELLKKIQLEHQLK